MKTKRRGYVAAVAVTAMIGGLLPLLTAGTAAAGAPGGEPTAMTVSPSAAYTARGALNYATFTGNLVSADGAAGDVYYAVTSGPDANIGAPLVGTLCPGIMPLLPSPGDPFSCDVYNSSGNSGVDNVRFFYQNGGTGSYVAGDPTATATMTIGGDVDSAVLSPTSASAGTDQYNAYTVKVTDADGLPISGEPVTLDATQAGAILGTLDILTGPPAPLTTKTPGLGNDSLIVNTADGTLGTTAGVATFYVASDLPGTVNLTASAGTGSPFVSSSTGTLTVSSAVVNDATSVEITPATQNAFSGGTVQFNITVTNAVGNPIIGVTPRATVAGVNDGQIVTVGATDLTGTAIATYDALLPNQGLDTLTAWVDQSDNPVNTGGIDPGEPSGNATVNLGLEHFNSDALSSSGPVTVPTEITSAPVTFTLKSNDNSSVEGFQLVFTTNDALKYTLSQDNGVTDANGQVTVTVTNSAPADGDVATITATLFGTQASTPVVSDDETVTWEARSAVNPVITPSVSSTPTGGTASFTASIEDNFGNPVPGVTYTWLVVGPRNDATNNTGVTGTGSSFSYTDTGPLNMNGIDFVTVTAMNSAGGVIGYAEADQYWILGNGLATQANLDLPSYSGYYNQAGLNTPFVPTNFNKAFTTGTTSNPTPTTPVVAPLAVTAALIDANGFPLFGKTVTFTSSGVGGFTDFEGNPIAGNSTTAIVADSTGPETLFAHASVFVRSTQVGTQTITATVDGITDTAIVTYTGQYVPVNPVRVADTRNNQGGIADWNGNPVPADGRLAPNTLYYFDYDTTAVPQDMKAIAFNITGIDPDTYGNLRVASACNEDETVPNTDIPSTSLLNYQVGSDIANFAIMPTGRECDEIKIYSDNASVAVAIDMVGYYPSSEGIQDLYPSRVVDTRTGLGGGSGPVVGGTSRTFQITGSAGIPAGTKAVALNITAIGPDGQGNLRVYPEGSDVPNASIINYIPGVDKAAYVVVNLPANGQLSVYSDGGTADVAIDAFAYYPDSSTMVTGAPNRILDTRTGLGGLSTLAANTVESFQVAGLNGVPADAQAVLVTLTGIATNSSTGFGNLRIYPAGDAVPVVSTLNYVNANSDVANFAIVKLGANGELSLYSDGSEINAAVDLVGYIPAGGSNELN